MTTADAAYSVALLIRAAIVGWCAMMIFEHERRITRMETRAEDDTDLRNR